MYNRPRKIPCYSLPKDDNFFHLCFFYSEVLAPTLDAKAIAAAAGYPDIEGKYTYAFSLNTQTHLLQPTTKPYTYPKALKPHAKRTQPFTQPLLFFPQTCII